MPHMHVRGKDFEYKLVYPDGKEKILLRVPKYDFNWQLNYWLKSRSPRRRAAASNAWRTTTIRPPTNSIPTRRITVRWGIKPGKR